MADSRLRQIREDDLEIIMTWRMSPEITKYMCSDPRLTMEDQKKWYERIKNEDNSFYWIYEYQNDPVGLVSLVGWDKGNSIIHSGAYIADHSARGLNNIIEMNMNHFAYAFEKIGVHRLAIEIMSNNIGQIRWVQRFGAIKEGVLRQAIQKNGEYYDLYLFSILSSEWPVIIRKIHFNRIEIEEKVW